MQTSFPADLASAVIRELRRKGRPPLEVLTRLFETIFFASLETEEGQPIQCHVVYLDPQNPDPSPPERKVRDRWQFTPLGTPIPFEKSVLVKLARASDPRTSSLAVFPDETGELLVWGLVDQGNHYADYINYDTESGQLRPGQFQASIEGVGHVAAFKGFEKIAELRGDRILLGPVDVLKEGPVREQLSVGIAAYVQTVRSSVPQEVYQDRDHWPNSLSQYWIESLCRLLLRIRNYRHGGAILITPDVSNKHLNIKYQLQYDRLMSSLVARGASTILNTFAEDEIFTDYMDEVQDYVPMDLYLDASVEDNIRQEALRELDGALWFVSLLSRVDGVIVMTPHLEVRGFGAEITVNEAPSKVRSAADPEATAERLGSLDYNHLGTRHRSVMRYCWAVPNSVGFIISQDGSVRAVTRRDGTLLIWNQVLLHRFWNRKQNKKPMQVKAPPEEAAESV